MFQLRKDPMRETYFAKIFYLYLKSYSVGKINQALGRSLGYFEAAYHILTKTR